MTDRLLVLMGDRVAGVLTRDRDRHLTFEYEEEYRAMSDATPLSVSMPIQVRRHRDRVVSPWLWGLLPDNERVLRRWAERFHVSPSSPFALLATPVGLDCAGAVRFVSEEHVDAALVLPGSVRWLTDAEIGNRIRELRRDITAWLGADFTGRFSLAGLQAKTALAFVNGRWGLPEGSAATSHIIKPAIAGFDDHDLNEHICMRAAFHAGLVVAPTELAVFDGECVVVVERYDRVLQDDGMLLRLHQEDMCQALGRHPSAKYQADGGPAPGEIAALFRTVMPPRLSEDTAWRFLDALVWNWIIGGTDAHAKNYSFVLHRDEIRLAPLYDIASGLPYSDERELRLAMKLGGDYRLHVQRPSTWSTLASELRLDHEEVRARAHSLASAAPHAFAAALSDIPDVGSQLPARMGELIEARAKRCLRMLG